MPRRRRSALYGELGVDFGDAVLFDGAPITQHRYGDREVPVFPHLATLERGGYLIVPFVGAQPHEGAIRALDQLLPHDIALYVHTEQVVFLCASCWGDAKHDRRGHDAAEHRVVRGKLCAPKSLPPAELRRLLDEATATHAGIQVLAPELSRLVGDAARAEVETRRMAMVGKG